jgi:hypothetical protein
MLHPDPEPGTSDVSAAQVASLDDRFFAANQPAYFQARIDALLAPTPTGRDDQLIAGVARLGVVPALFDAVQVEPEDRRIQRAIDSFVLRHHLAEVLVRTAVALAEADKVGETSSIWLAIADDYRRTVDLSVVLDSFTADPSFGFTAARMLLGAENVQPAVDQHGADHVGRCVQVAWSWVGHARDVVCSSDGQIDVGAAANKLKHGLAAAASAQTSVIATNIGPDADGNYHRSALQAALPLIDAVSIELLSRTPKKDGGAWDVTLLNLDPAPFLVEATAMNIVYGALFATAARKRSTTPRAPHPGLFPDLVPATVISKRTDGIREALTHAAGKPRRPTLIQQGGFVQTIEVQSKQSGIVVDDPPGPGVYESA